VSKKLVETLLLDTAPSSISGDPQVRAACKAIDAEFEAVTRCITEVIIIPNIGQITDKALLDLLATQFHVDFYQDMVQGGPPTIAHKQQLILTSLEWHTYKGTLWVVEEILKTLAMKDAHVTEWYDYGGTPYHFQIVTADPIVDSEAMLRVIAGIYAVKNARSWMEGFIRKRVQVQTLYCGCATMQQITTKIPLNKFEPAPPHPVPYPS
jgi:P2-related tail formation protein